MAQAIDAARLNENILRLRGHVPDVIPGQKRSGQQSPQGHVGAVFVRLHAAIAHLEHIGIIPVSRASEFLQAVLGKSDHRHAVVVVADIARGSPQIARRRPPLPRRLYPPIADAEHDGPSCLRQGVTKFRILHFRIKSFGMAPINLNVVHSPCRVGFRVLEFVIQASRALFAGKAAGVCVDAKLKAFAVYVVGESFDAGGKSGGIGDDRTVSGAADLPAVIDVHVVIAGRQHAAAHHGIRSLPDELLTHIAAEVVPTIPTHRRRLGQLSG